MTKLSKEQIRSILDHWSNLDGLTDYEKKFVTNFIIEVQEGTADRWLKEDEK